MRLVLSSQSWVQTQSKVFYPDNVVRAISADEVGDHAASFYWTGGELLARGGGWRLVGGRGGVVGWGGWYEGFW